MLCVGRLDWIPLDTYFINCVNGLYDCDIKTYEQSRESQNNDIVTHLPSILYYKPFENT